MALPGIETKSSGTGMFPIRVVRALEPTVPARGQEATTDPRLLPMRAEDAARRRKRMERRARKLQGG